MDRLLRRQHERKDWPSDIHNGQAGFFFPEGSKVRFCFCYQNIKYSFQLFEKLI